MIKGTQKRRVSRRKRLRVPRDERWRKPDRKSWKNRLSMSTAMTGRFGLIVFGAIVVGLAVVGIWASVV